jgi:ketopantoate reductase
MEDMLRPVISRQTVIVLIQNGVGQEVPLHTAFPATTIISCVVCAFNHVKILDLSGLQCWTGARTPDVGVVEVFTSDNLILGVDWDPRVTLSRTQQQQALDILADIFIESNAQITVQSDIQVDRWVKLIWYVPNKTSNMDVSAHNMRFFQELSLVCCQRNMIVKKMGLTFTSGIR